VFGAIRRWRRQRVIERAELDATLWLTTLDRLPFLRGLTADELARLRDTVILFLHQKSIRGAAGLQLDAAMQLMIAAQACILVLNLDIDYYRGWVEVIVYPDAFVPTIEYMDEDGVVHRDREARAGEAWLQGPVILSWADVAPAEDGVNVVIHEFAHKLDMLNGDANGYPPLHGGMTREAWTGAFTAAYEDFCRRVDADEDVAIDPYAAESPAEFFAVMSEIFFETPRLVLDAYPQVYAQLKAFYRQDPAARGVPHL
jgi:Mlc titration factor MtfA (ptsG expression regulator)